MVINITFKKTSNKPICHFSQSQGYYYLYLILYKTIFKKPTNLESEKEFYQLTNVYMYIL